MIKWPMVLLVNKRGGVISVQKPRAEALLKAGSHFNAPQGATAGTYLPQFDSAVQLIPAKEPVEDEVKTPKTTSHKKKSASSKKSK